MDPNIGSLALDFVNTAGSPTWGPDAIALPEGYVAWHQEALVGEARSPLPATLPEVRRLTQEAGRLRVTIDTLFDTIARGAQLPEPALFQLNRVLEEGYTTHHVVASDPGPRLHRLHHATSLTGTLAPIVLSALELVEKASPSRLRRCASANCARWFVDTSKGGRRRWCSMSVCGNRAKAARFRERHVGV